MLEWKDQHQVTGRVEEAALGMVAQTEKIGLGERRRKKKLILWTRGW
jgi:hypothetical protein